MNKELSRATLPLFLFANNTILPMEESNMAKKSQEGYLEIREFLLDFLKDSIKRGSLSESLLKEISLEQGDIIRPMKQVIMKDEEDWRGPLTEMLISDNPHLQVFAARFASSGLFYDNADVYNKLKKSFLELDDGDEGKAFYGMVPFYLRAYSDDNELQTKLKEYCKKTIDLQISLTMENFGGIGAARKATQASLQDPKTKNKHWFYQMVLDYLPNSDSGH